jgi:adenosylcobinamide-GDP ribazoletransferase
MGERVRPAVAAISFLTAVPVGRAIGDRDLRRGAVLFPLVGAAVGAVAAVAAWAVGLVLPSLPAAAIGVGTGVALTAALHLDGLGDVADGVGAALSGHDPAVAMRDPRLGTFGVASAVLDLLLKTSVIAALVEEGFPWAIVGVGAAARVAPIALAWRLPYVGGGTGGWTKGVHAGTTATATALAFIVVVVASLAPDPSAAPATVVAVSAAVVGVTIGLGRWSRRRLGGVTGDVFGAAVELGETAGLTAALAIVAA